jgi:hypothetical protein
MPDWPRLGFGVGLRAEHYDTVLTGHPRVDWFEAISENYSQTGGRPLAVLEQVRCEYPIALHGVALSIGSTDPLDAGHLESLRALVARVEPALVTDHLCWTGAGGRSLYDLLPLPYTEEALVHVVERVRRVQDFLGRRILLENPSTYVAFRHSTMTEWEFLAAVAEEADSGILLDVNNVYVSAHNLGFDPLEYLDAIPPSRVGQMHLAGFTDMGTYLFDTHSAPVHEDVWRLYRHAVRRFPEAPTLIEWDADIPAFERLHAEMERARREAAGAHGSDERPLQAEFLEAAELTPVADDRRSPDANLETIQGWMAACVSPLTPADAAEAAAARLEASLRLPVAADPEVRLGVYVNGFPARIREALAETFPAVAHVVGPRAFTALGERYVAAVPLRSWNLNDAGDGLPRFLASDELSSRFAFLPDLAELERQVSRAFHAREAAPLDPAPLAAWPLERWERAAFRFQPSVCVVRSPWPIHDIWEARDTELAEIYIDLRDRPQNVLVHRTGLTVRCKTVADGEALALEELLAGRPLGRALEKLAAFPLTLSPSTSLRTGLSKGEPAEAVFEWFAGWMRLGLITTVSSPDLCAGTTFHEVDGGAHS